MESITARQIEAFVKERQLKAYLASKLSMKPTTEGLAIYALPILHLQETQELIARLALQAFKEAEAAYQRKEETKHDL